VIPQLIPESERITVNKEVNLTKRIRISQGLRYCAVTLAANGRVRPDYVIVNGKEERHPEGVF
jgi:hypothetical protein